LSKSGRTERLILLMKVLAERPGELIPLSYFTDRFHVAKSTISEDLTELKSAIELDERGLLQTHYGAIGGVQYWPLPSPTQAQRLLQELCGMLRDPGRIMPGGFVYMTDILTNPVWSSRLGEILAAQFRYTHPDAVLTVETKGIPLAQMVARAMGVPMIMARREGRVTEGPSITVHYISGVARRVHTMTVGLRTLKRGSKVLVVDDFMKAGATARGMVDLVSEVGVHVVGVGVLVSTIEPQKKRIDQYVSLLTLVNVNEEERIVTIHPTSELGPGE